MDMFLWPWIIGIGIAALFFIDWDDDCCCDHDHNGDNTSGNGTDTVDGAGAGLETGITMNADNVMGTAGDDIISSIGGNDTVFGLDGNDDLDGGNANDWMYGGAGIDQLNGGMGADSLFGGAGDDAIGGAGGVDELFGDAGSDTLLGQDASDTIDGGAGNDLLIGGAAADTLIGGTGNDVLIGGYVNADDSVAGEVDTDLEERAHAARIAELSGSDPLILTTELRSNDNDGSDVLFGGSGDDSIYLGSDDTVTGGTGADDFFVRAYAADDTVSVGAKVLDYNAAEDEIFVEYDASNNGAAPTIEVRNWNGDAVVLVDDKVLMRLEGQAGNITVADVNTIPFGELPSI